MRLGRDIPPGDAGCGKPRSNRAWRQFSFAVNQLKAAIEPKLDLRSVINRWNQIGWDWSERCRNREPQIKVFSSLS